MTMHAKKGQISMEVLYSIGVMLIIFLILTGISFQRRIDTLDTMEFLDKRTVCHAIADAVSSVSAAGSGTFISMYMRYDAQILKGAIVVGEIAAAANPDAVTANCAYSANVTTAAPPYAPPITLNQGTTHKIENIKGNVQIT